MNETQRSAASVLSASQAVAMEINGIHSEVDHVIVSIRDIAESTHKQSVATNEMARTAGEVNRMTMETDQSL